MYDQLGFKKWKPSQLRKIYKRETSIFQEFINDRKKGVNQFPNLSPKMNKIKLNFVQRPAY